MIDTPEGWKRSESEVAKNKMKWGSRRKYNRNGSEMMEKEGVEYRRIEESNWAGQDPTWILVPYIWDKEGVKDV